MTVTFKRILLLFLFGLFIVMLIKALTEVEKNTLPLRWLSSIENQYILDTVQSKSFPSIYYSHSFRKKIKEKAFTEALLKQLPKDSISLIIDFEDSTVSLWIHGVHILKNNFTVEKREDIFNHLSNYSLSRIYSEPQIADSILSSVVKEPIVIKDAPKNPNEVINEVPQIDSLQEVAILRIFFTSKYLITLVPNDLTEKRDLKSAKYFIESSDPLKFKDYLLSKLKVIEVAYQPEIRVGLPSIVIRDIFRALPQQPAVIVRL